MTRAAAPVTFAIAVILVPGACRRESALRSTDLPSTYRQVAARSADAGVHADAGAHGDANRLPEDPVAGRQSEIQWRAHLDAEERERQLGYDRRRLKEHKALLGLLAAARARYDRAKTETAVARARRGMPPMIEDLRRRVTAIDHWGVNSPVLPDYDVLIAALADSYPDVRIAAMKGDTRALDTLRADLDRRMSKIADWLTDAAASEDE